MLKRRLHSFPRFVEHPRYGFAPHTSGLNVPEEEIRRGFWSLSRETMFPESVIPADTSKQNCSVYPRKYYVDVERKCRTCERPFLFFAKEQRYWYEALGFFVDADCVNCPDCRRSSRNLHRRLRRYSDAMASSALSVELLEQLVGDAEYLFKHGVLRNTTVLGALKNRARREIPLFKGTHLLETALAEAKALRRET